MKKFLSITLAITMISVILSMLVSANTTEPAFTSGFESEILGFDGSGAVRTFMAGNDDQAHKAGAKYALEGSNALRVRFENGGAAGEALEKKNAPGNDWWLRRSELASSDLSAGKYELTFWVFDQHNNLTNASVLGEINLTFYENGISNTDVGQDYTKQAVTFKLFDTAGTTGIMKETGETKAGAVGTATWKKFKAEIQIPKDVSAYAIWLKQEKTVGTTQTFTWIDNMSVAPVVETSTSAPSTGSHFTVASIVLCASAGAILLVNKRKHY